MEILANDRDEAVRLAERAQFRRHERFPLTFQRLDESLDSGRLHQLLARDPRTPDEYTKAVHRAQVELRKRDQGRYDDGEFKIEKVEEVPA